MDFNGEFQINSNTRVDTRALLPKEVSVANMLPESMRICGLSKQVMREPQTLVPCGHSIDRHVWDQWRTTQPYSNLNTCPICQKTYTTVETFVLTKLLENYEMQRNKPSSDLILQVADAYQRLPQITEISNIITLFNRGCVRVAWEKCLEIIGDNSVCYGKIFNLIQGHVLNIEKRDAALKETGPMSAQDQTSSSGKKRSREVIAISSSDEESNKEEVAEPTPKQRRVDSNESPKNDHDEDSTTLLDPSTPPSVPVLTNSTDLPPSEEQSQKNFEKICKAFKESKLVYWDSVDKFIINRQDGEKNTILHLAIKRYAQPLKQVQQCLGLGALIDAKNSEGNTPLHFAALYNRIKVITELLSKGADATIENNQGHTPIVLAGDKAAKAFKSFVQ